MPRLVQRLIRAAMRAYPFSGGHGRIVDSPTVRAIKFPEARLRVRTRAGFDLTVMPNDFIGRYVYYTGRALSHDVAEVLLSLARPGDRILDVGANVGYISCALLHGCEGCRVAAVEPQPECFALLSENLAPFGGRGVAVRAAVSDHEGVGTMEVANNLGKSHLVASAEEVPEERRLEVQLLTGKAVMAASGLDRLDLVKIDVEGHEESVLKSLEPVFREHPPRAVVFEHFGDPTAEGSVINEMFRRLGYDLMAIRRGWFGWRLVPAASYLRQGGKVRDYVAVLKEGAKQSAPPQRGEVLAESGSSR